MIDHKAIEQEQLQRAIDAAKPEDWPEDFYHDNGQYFNSCCVCRNTFTGHKRRWMCKLCKTKRETNEKL